MLLLNNVLLSTSVCCSICGIGMPKKWQATQTTIHVHQIFFELVENATENMVILKVAFGKQTVGRIQVCE